MAQANPSLTPAESADSYRELRQSFAELHASFRQLKWMAIGWGVAHFVLLCILLFFAGRIILRYYGIG